MIQEFSSFYRNYMNSSVKGDILFVLLGTFFLLFLLLTPLLAQRKDADADGYYYEERNAPCDEPQKFGAEVRVTFSSGGSAKPSLIWTGSEYGISWCDDRDGNYEISFARLDSSGSKIGPDIRVTHNSARSYFPSLVWTGIEYGISWEDDRDGDWEIYFARLDSLGNKMGPDVRITYDSSHLSSSTLVWAGNEYGISWCDNRCGNYGIYFVRLDSSGNKIGSETWLIVNYLYPSSPSLVWNGNEYGISWFDNQCCGDMSFEIYFARLDSSGNKIGSDVRITQNASFSGFPSLVWNGNEYGVSWEDDRDETYGEIYFARLDSSGSKIGSDVRVTHNASFSGSPLLVWNGSEYGVSWQDERDGNYEIYFAQLDLSGSKTGSDIRVTDNFALSYSPSSIWTGSEYGVSWHDDRDGDWEIYFTRIGCSIEAFIDFDPDTLNLKSKGKWMTCYIALPEEYSVTDIDISTVTLSVNASDPIHAEISPINIGDHDKDGITDLMMKFDRSLIRSVTPSGDSVPFEVSGKIYSGKTFKGLDVVNVIEK